MKKHLLILLVCLSGYSFSQEDCADGIDNDTDGLIDLNDPDCACAGFTVSGSNVFTNPSFEDMLCCPTGYGQLTCADTWMQATTAAGGFSDYFHTCGFFSTGGLLTDASLPAPDGDGWAGFISGWESGATHNEYVAQCLSSTLLAGTSYTLTGFLARGDGNADLDLTIYGTGSCGDLPWSTTTCPDGLLGWGEVAVMTVNMPTYGDWVPFTISFTPPFDMNAIAVGGNCITAAVPATDTYNYYYIDDLELIGSGGFTGGSISEVSSACTVTDLTASIGATGGSWQWYLEGIALVGETGPNLDITGTGAGNYQAVYTIADSCHQLDHTVIPSTVAADFNWVDTCYTDVTSFIDASTFGSGSITSYLWDLGDGGAFSFLPNPTHTFSGPGSYNVTLTISHSSGCDDVISQTVEIEDCYASTNELTPNAVSLYPNPSSGRFSIEFDHVPSKTSIIIRDATGKTIMDRSVAYLSKMLDVSLPATGVYFIEIDADGWVSNHRIINISE